jgi:hypothetical protein
MALNRTKGVRLKMHAVVLQGIVKWLRPEEREMLIRGRPGLYYSGLLLVDISRSEVFSCSLLGPCLWAVHLDHRRMTFCRGRELKSLRLETL